VESSENNWLIWEKNWDSCGARAGEDGAGEDGDDDWGIDGEETPFQV
jgi:hypothetical protein